MPLYSYRCAAGHQADLVRPIGTETLACPVCSGLARRGSVHRVSMRQPEVDTRGLYRRFTEATAEMDDSATRIEASTGQPVAMPNLWQASKAKARAMVAAGETEFKSGA